MEDTNYRPEDSVAAENNMNTEQKEKKGSRHGIIAAVLLMIAEVFCALYVFSPLQYYFGMWGLIATELGILQLTIIFAIIFRVPFKELIPFKRIEFSKVAGVAIMWIGIFLLSMIINLVFFFVFPEGLDTAKEMDSFFGAWSGLPLYFVIAVMPAICEESMHRGFIQSGLKKRIKNKWILCIIMGILFGIFHLDPYRFLATAMLGGVMSYILIETDNFFYNMQFHFMNNFIIQLISGAASKVVTEEQVQVSLTKASIPMSFAVYCIIGCLAPLITLGGILLIKGRNKIKEGGKTRLTASIIFASVSSFVILLCGVVLLCYIISSGMEVVY